MDHHDRPPALQRLRSAMSALSATRSDVVALALLAAGALVLLAALWWAQRPATEGVAADQEAEPSAASPGSATSDAQPHAVGIERSEGPIVVHVAGLVRHPGVQQLPGGARVADALEAAGGALPEAWLDAVNLARPLSDGEQLLVPPKPEPGQAQVPPSGGAPGAGPVGAAAAVGGVPGGVRPDGTIDLNRATVAELETLPGIGPVMAARIVEHREANGQFTSVGQLRDVRGIGEKTFQALAELVSV